MPTATKLNRRVTVQVVCWNSLPHLPYALAALEHQSYSDFFVLLIDNASADGTVRWLEERYPHLHLLRNTRNLGFSRAHNQGFRLSRTDYVLVLNPDVLLEPDWLARGVAYLDAHPRTAGFGGKLRRYEYSTDELKEVLKSDIIDSAGIQMFRNRHVIERGAGQLDRGQFDNGQFVLGLTGACMLIRRDALESVRWRQEYFDEDFFAYKEDVDLAWRLQRLGWSNWYDPGAQAYHHREARGVSRRSNLALARNHRARSHMITQFSYRNQIAWLIKHETWSSWWRDAAWILWYELRKLLWLALTQPGPLWRAWRQILRLWPKMRSKGKDLQAHAKRSQLDVRREFLRPA